MIKRVLALLLSAAAWVSAQDKPPSWRIQGQFSEACSCNVPCACNFGERPSPHEFCHTMWSYAVKRGNWDRVSLDGMRIGGVDGPVGVMGLLDVRAGAAQRQGMENIWHLLSGRLFCLMRLWPFKAGGDEPDPARPARQSSVIRTRYADRQFLGFEYVSIEQSITEKGMRLHFAGRGGFEANYIMGRDPARPITVTNNTSWPIPVSIKAKTIFLKYGDKFNQLDYQGTNANQGDFDISNRDQGAVPMAPPK
jgi:Protein of unknown function (DUF1326)